MDKALVGAMDVDKVVELGDKMFLAPDSQSAQISWFPSFVLSVNEVSSMDIYHDVNQKSKNFCPPGIRVWSRNPQSCQYTLRIGRGSTRTPSCHQ